MEWLLFYFNYNCFKKSQKVKIDFHCLKKFILINVKHIGPFQAGTEGIIIRIVDRYNLQATL